MRIRAAVASDLPLLAQIEAAAGVAFADVGMLEIANDSDPTVEELRPYQESGRAWVAVDDEDQPVAYLIAEIVDGCGHIEQVSVHPRHAGQRIGRSLIDHAAGWAVGQGLAALTLTTFADVAWNAPYYRRCGFRTLSEDELTPELRHIRSEEGNRGLDKWPRVAMIRAW